MSKNYKIYENGFLANLNILDSERTEECMFIQ